MKNQEFWVIPYKKYELPKTEIVHYWMIELTLTSGKVHNFYVKARDKVEALKTAHSYHYLASLPKLRKSTLVLRH